MENTTETGSSDGSSSSSFMTSSGSEGSLNLASHSPLGNRHPSTLSGDQEDLLLPTDMDSLFPPYELFDDDDYGEFLESVKLNCITNMPVALNSRNPSRPSSPCRQAKIEEVLMRIDQLIGLSQTHLAANKAGQYHIQSQKHKHLVELVHEHMSGYFTEDERLALLNIVSSVDQTQSKWAHPGRIGQAELYGALEKVLLELKAFTPYSVPFSTRVSRKEVTDYYDVIKKPMDLGTMMRKLKGFVYNNKREFQADLQRIYNNCFTYNTDPNSQLRLHVTLLRDKWTRLMAEVPEIEVKTVAIPAAVSVASDGSPESVSSFSSLPSSTSQAVVKSSDTQESFHIEIEEFCPSNAAPLTGSPVPKLATIIQRNANQMGLYHKGRVKSFKKPKRKGKENLFYPELVFPNQTFPDAIHICKPPVAIDENPSCFDEILLNFDLWRRLRCAIYQIFSVSGDQDSDMLPATKLNKPSFTTDSKLLVERQTKSVIALLLSNVGFTSSKSDAISLLKDLLFQKIETLTLSIKTRMASNFETSAKCLGRIIFPPDGQPFKEHAKLKLYMDCFLSSRYQRIQRAIAQLHDHKLEMRARADQASFAEIDVVNQDSRDQLEPGLEDDDDLLSVALDEEDLLLDNQPLADGGAGSSATDLDLFGLKDATMTESTITNELLALPKRSFDMSESGLEGTLDPIQFIGEPSLKRLDDD